jgi:outer membrane receptor protein involved in Fe transport
VAVSLFEQRTPGFAVWNLRGFWRPSNSLTLIGGVENFTDRFYREHLDYRSGRGVFRPGINFYTAVELAY